MTNRMPERETQVKALASQSRMEILRLLIRAGTEFADQWSADPVETGVCMNSIAKKMGVSQPTASRHIDLLRRAGFITVKKQQKWAYCQRDEAALAEYHAWLAEHLSLEANPPQK